MVYQIKFLKHTAKGKVGETVLDALERAGAAVASSCRAGACQMCLMRLVEGQVPASAQQGLKQSLKDTGHFLSCICKPSQNIVCEPASSAAYKGHCTLLERTPIGPDVIAIKLSRPPGFVYFPGQFLTLERKDGLARSYSIASNADEQAFLEIHVRRIPGGRFSQWIHDQASPGEILTIAGPRGDCRYYPAHREEALVLVGTGTGIAPLYAIAYDALKHRHQGLISIYHGAVSEDRFYWVKEFLDLEKNHPQLSYTRCVLRNQISPEVRIGDISKIVLAETNQKDTRSYLCGDPGLVKSLKKQLFLSGKSLSKIHSDPFIGTEK